MLSESEIAEFKKLFQKHFGEEISREDAIRRGEKLIRLVKVTRQNYSLINK